jgi:hypothetical protein
MRHEHRRANPLAADVAEKKVQPVAVGLNEIAVIAADQPGRLIVIGDIGVRLRPIAFVSFVRRSSS